MMKDASMSPQSIALHPAGQRFGVALDVPNPKPSLMPFLLQASGRVQRKLAHRLIMPTYDGEPDEATAGPASSDPTSAAAAAAARASCKKGHRLPATAVVLSGDESFAVTVSKDGSIIKWDLATLQRTRLFRPGERASGKPLPPGHGEDAATSSGPEWVKRNPRQASKRGLYAAALSSDGKFLAVGGGDRKVHVFDAATGAFLQSFPGHRDTISALAFRDGTHQLFRWVRCTVALCRYYRCKCSHTYRTPAVHTVAFTVIQRLIRPDDQDVEPG